MALDPEIRRMMNAIVMWSPSLGKTDHGDSEYLLPQYSILARVEPREDQTRESADGESVSYAVAVYTETRLPEGAMLWLPGVPTLSQEYGRIVKNIAEMHDEDGSVSHFEVLC